MEIPSDIRYTRKVSAKIEDLLRANNVDGSAIFDIRLCVEEAIKNSIIHGNKSNKTLPVFISYSLKGDRFTIEIEDQGNGFNPAKVPDPTRDENIWREGGRGIFLMRKLMDEVKYDNGGNKVFMLKFVKKNKPHSKRLGPR